jgi:hypothetical protein
MCDVNKRVSKLTSYCRMGRGSRHGGACCDRRPLTDSDGADVGRLGAGQSWLDADAGRWVDIRRSAEKLTRTENAPNGQRNILEEAAGGGDDDEAAEGDGDSDSGRSCWPSGDPRGQGRSRSVGSLSWMAAPLVCASVIARGSLEANEQATLLGTC